MIDADLSEEDYREKYYKEYPLPDDCPLCAYYECEDCEHDENEIRNWLEEQKQDAIAESMADKHERDIETFDENFGED